jgi:geranylgeranyl pyrophosphate synthase
VNNIKLENKSSVQRQVSNKSISHVHILKTLLKNNLISILPEKGHSLHQVASYHFNDFGKMLRGTTSLAIASAIELNEDAAINWALSVELMHNASLVHDDVCDEDSQRRHNPTIFANFGAPLAICFGDWLVAKSFEHAALAAKECNGDASSIITLLSNAMAKLSAGQAREFSGGPILDWVGYDNVVNGKTVPLLAAAVEGPLLLANQSKFFDDIKHCIESLGIGYQISNDILDALGKDGSDEAFNDLYRRAPNAVSITFRNTLKNGHRLQFDNWMNSEPQIENIDWASQINENGAIDNCVKQLKQHLECSRLHRSRLPHNLQQALLPLVTYLEREAKKMCSSNIGDSESV